MDNGYDDDDDPFAEEQKLRENVKAWGLTRPQDLSFTSIKNSIISLIDSGISPSCTAFPPSCSVNQVRMNKGEVLVGGDYILKKKIGAGSFGEVYRGVSKSTGQEVAVKLEDSSVKHPQLEGEYRLYKKLEGGVGIPVAKWYGQERQYNCLVLDLLGPSLEDLFNYCDRSFSMKTVLMLAEQMIDRIQYLHKKNYIHRDLKPENMLMGTGEHIDEVFLIDFGLAKKYGNSNGDHIRYSEDKGMCGTARFTSVNSHLGVEQSRRDDLEGIAYILMYFNLKGTLPWQNIKSANKKQKYEKICEYKMRISPEQLCRRFPAEFALYLRYVQGLEFKEKPNYKYLREMFKKLYRTLKFHQTAYVFDWTKKAERAGR